jgi:D-alanyl-D-alanine carboxypeptidase
VRLAPGRVLTTASAPVVPLLLLLSLAGILIPASRAQVPAPADPAITRVILTERIDALVEAARVEMELPGVSIVLLRGDSVLLARGYGFADIEHEVAATENTIFGIGSLSKQFAAAAVMRLVEQDRVGLDDPVHTHLPEFPEGGMEITIRHLLRQTSGLADYGAFPEIVEIRRRADIEPAQFDLAGGIRLVSQAPRRFEPGEWWSYSGANYLLLTAIVERVTGVSFHDYLTGTLLEPLGLRATHVCGHPNRGVRARGYEVEDGSFSVRPLARNTADAGSGGLCASAMEIALWKRALVGGRAVASSSFRQMIEVTQVGAGFAPPYGFGLSLVPVAGRPAIWHTGVISGHTSVLAYLPDDDLTIAMITNRRRADLTALFRRVVRATLDLPEPVLEDLPVSAEQIDHVSGAYDDYLFTISVFEDTGRLHARISEMDLTLPLLFQGRNEFATVEPDFRFWFEPPGQRAQRVVFEWDEIRSYAGELKQ